MVLRCGSSPAASPRVAKRSVPPRWGWLVPAATWLTSPQATAPARVSPVMARKARRERPGATDSPGTCTISASPYTTSIGPPGASLLGVTIFRIGQHIHNGRSPGSQRRGNGPANVTGPFRPGPKAIKRLGYFTEVLRAEGDRVWRHLTSIINIATPFHTETLVVDDDVHYREVEPDRRLEFHDVIAKPTVARDA